MTANDFYTPESGILTRMSRAKRDQLIGEIVGLMLGSEMYRRYFINDIGAVFLPPIHLNQFRIYRQGERPVGLVTWAWLTEETERKYVAGKYNLRPEDWNAGDLGWIIDFMAPFGHAAKIVHDLKHNIFSDKIGKAIRMTPEGRVRGIWKLHGVNRINEARGMCMDDLRAGLQV
ncbi:MAG: hypothetical protein A2514_09320 [Gammaproteobacteria bacterium RIFOXYD12_FULL_61_37]|nr:MAG: hypothetical protein A2514_09320 [Gammaproteobacteria bacterium RIFOXYD12_FULL_61_37]